MSRILDFYKRYKNTFDTQVNITNTLLMERNDFLAPYMPMRSYFDSDLLVLKAKKSCRISNVVGFGGEIPERKRGDITVTEQGLIKFGTSHVYTEQDMKLMREWDIKVAGNAPGAAQGMGQIKDYIFGTVNDLPMAIGDTHQMLTTQALYSGAIDFTDTVTEQKVEVSFTSNSSQFLSALTSGNRWNQATGTPIANLRSHAEYYRITSGVGQPASVVMNENTYNKAVATTEFQNAASALRVGGTADLIVSDEEAQDIFNRSKVPPLVVVNEKYEDLDGNEQFFVPDGYYFFVWEGMGERALGPVESNDGQPGVYTFIEEVSKEPPVDRAVGTATGIPFIFDNRKMGGRKVY